MDGKDSDCNDRNKAGNVANSDAARSANGLGDLTPEQLVILHEKSELEKLLEVTKNLQQQANLFFSAKETASSSSPPSASREQKKLNASESSETREGSSRLRCSSNDNDELSQITDADDRSTVTSEPPKRDADKTEGAKVPSTKHAAVCEYPDSGGSGDPLSLRGNVRLLEENAELLRKKIELEVLLHRAKILLEHTPLLEGASDNAGSDEFSVENNVEKISQAQSTLDSKVQTSVDDNSGTVCNNNINNNNIDEDNQSNLEAFYEKASELTNRTNSLLDVVVHQNKTPCSNESQEENTNCPMLNNSYEDVKLASHSASTRGASDRLGESETRSDIDKSEKEHVEATGNNNNKTELYYDKHTIQRLLQKADLLLEQANCPRWSAENASKDQINKETEALHTIANEESRLGQESSNVLDQVDDESTDEDDDDDDPSFDAKFHLQQLLQRAKTVLERSKLPARERFLEHEALDASQTATEETHKRLEEISDLSASKTESLNNENKSSDAVDSEEKLPEIYEATVSLEKVSAAQTTDVSETDFDSLTQDAQLDFLIRTTSALKQKADSLINQISEQENPSTQEENHEGVTTNGHRPAPENTTNAKQENPISTQLDRTTVDTAAIDCEKNRALIFEPAEVRQYADGCQLEYEEVEESQLQINENDKSPLEIEDEYASDTCDMMLYYEDNDASSSDEEETDFSEAQTDGITAELLQLQRVTDLLVENSEFANETIDTWQSGDNNYSTNENECLLPSVPICNGHNNEQENLTYPLQQAPPPGAFDNYSASSDVDFLNRTGDASQAPADKDGTTTVGDLAGEDGAFDERTELRLLLEKTKLLLETAQQPIDVEKEETETVVNIFPDDINPIKHKDSTANEDSALKSDEISEFQSSANQDISTVDIETKTFDHAEVIQPQSCGRSPENVAEKTLISEKQSPCESRQVTCPVFLPESEEFADEEEKILRPVKERETSPKSVLNADDDVNKQGRLLSVADSSELLSAQLTQLKAEVNTIIQEASVELTDSLETKTDLESSFNCNNAAAKPRKNDSHDEDQPQIPDTLCSGHHSISKDITEVATTDQQQRIGETGANESSHTGTGVPETDAKTNGAKTGEPKNLKSLSSLTKLLSLQKDMARMQLHLTNLQDSLRTTSATLQEILDEAFSDM